MTAVFKHNYSFLNNISCWWVQVHTTKYNLLLSDTYKHNRAPRITSCMYDSNDMIFHIVTATKNSMEDAMNVITR